MAEIRLDKYISEQFGLTRSESRKVIRRGKVLVNETPLCDPSQKVDTALSVTFDGKTVCYEEKVYLMLNKPKGVVCATEDKQHTCVTDLLTPEYIKKGLFPVGRLDKDTTGFLILTNDGEFAHKVISPKSGIDKVYSVTLDGAVTDGIVKQFSAGIILADGTNCLPAKLNVNSTDSTKATVTIKEGKYHQIKRMFGVVDLGVNELKRESIGSVVLDKNLAEGEYRRLTKAELEQILQKYKNN